MSRRLRIYALFTGVIILFVGALVVLTGGADEVAPVAGPRAAEPERVETAEAPEVGPAPERPSGETSPRAETPERAPEVEPVEESPVLRETSRAAAADGRSIAGTVTLGTGGAAAGATVFAVQVDGLGGGGRRGRDASDDGDDDRRRRRGRRRADPREVASAMDPGSGATVARGVTDGQGGYHLVPVPSGPLLVVAQMPGFARATSQVVVPEEGQASANLTLAAGGVVEGRVVDGTGRPVEGATVQALVRNPTERPPASGTSAEDGTFSLDGLADGERYLLVARADGHVTSRGPRVTASRRGMEIVLERGGRLAGVVVDAASGQPVPGARVEADLEGRRSTRGREDRARTGDDGSFLIEGLSAGEYAIEVESDAYPARRVDSFEVEAGRTVEGIRVEMVAGGSIAGVVRDDATGSGVSDALVYVSAGSEGGPGPMPFRMELPDRLRRFLDDGTHATTDGDGRFRIREAPAGRVRVSVVHPRYRSTEESVEVSPGLETDGVELRLEGGARVHGTVLDEEGRRLAEAAVVVAGNGLVRSGETDEEGRFAVGGLPEGSFTVRLTERRFRSLVSVEVQLREGESRRLTLRPEPRITVTGTVLRSGRPVAGARVDLDAEEGGGRRRTRDRSDDEGRYEVDDVTPGVYEVSVDGTTLPGRLEVPEGARGPVHHDLSLPGGTIEGRVVARATGEAVRGERVLVYETGPDGERVGGDRTEDDGTYRIDGLAGGTYRIVVSADDHAQTERDDVQLADGGTAIGIDFELVAGAPLTGSVLDAKGEPVPGAVLWIESAETGSGQVGSFWDSRTDADGLFEVDDLAEGPYRVTAGAAGFACRTEEVSVRGDESRVDLVLPAGGTLDLTVVGPGGGPVAGAEVEPVHLDGQRLRIPVPFLGNEARGSTDGEGRFLRSHLPPGPYEVTVRGPDGSETVAELALPDGETLRREVVLP